MVEADPYDVEIKEWLAEKLSLSKQFKAEIVKETKKAILLNVFDKDINRGELWFPKSTIIRIEG